MFCVAVVHQTLEDDVVRLRTFRPGDLEFLYSLLATPEIGLRSRTRGVTPSPDEFRQLIWRDAFVLFIVDSVTTGPVSYTHLDVYKRQYDDRSSFAEVI